MFASHLPITSVSILTDMCLSSVCIVSILRLQSLVAISNSEDPTYDNPPAATWSSVEINVGIICSCLPCLRPLLNKCFPRIFPPSFQRSADSHSWKAKGVFLSLTNSKFSSASTIDKRDDQIRVVTVVEMHREGSKEDQPDGNNRETEEQCASSAEHDR
ncbi:hypothetical protein GQ44DRAFT_207239 [Phaeosphaeriaceae sp. PMI808]|nr:hypothetical protein GQ44DRAFT_207239 [Phaeosphaeriaceae sp. PMI808]